MSTTPASDPAAESAEELEALRYPIGRFRRVETLTAGQRVDAIETLSLLPSRLREATLHLSDEQLNTPYRPGGWTVRQLIHHVADSHLNACARYRLALTEDFPTIKPYDEHLWAELSDARSAPIALSLDLLTPLHARWVRLLESIPPADFDQRGYVHPQAGRQTLAQVLALYAWHSHHHTAHITTLVQRSGW